jgi:hypothetical protein
LAGESWDGSWDTGSQTWLKLISVLYQSFDPYNPSQKTRIYAANVMALSIFLEAYLQRKFFKTFLDIFSCFCTALKKQTSGFLREGKAFLSCDHSFIILQGKAIKIFFLKKIGN